MSLKKTTRNTIIDDKTDCALVAGRASLDIPREVEECLEHTQQRQAFSIQNRVQEARHKLVLTIFLLFVIVSAFELVIVASRGGAIGVNSSTLASDGRLLRTALSDVLTGAVWQRGNDSNETSQPN